MKLDRLYLLKPQFMDQGKGPYFCPHCALLVGLMEFYPALTQQLEVRWLDFPRPRAELIDLLGEENQSCPVLVLHAFPEASLAKPPLQQAKGGSSRARTKSPFIWRTLAALEVRTKCQACPAAGHSSPSSIS
jgi:hypothetical protein